MRTGQSGGGMLERFAARVEWLAVQAEVEAMVSNGYGIKLAYKKLIAHNSITMSYPTFYSYFRKWRESRMASESLKPSLSPPDDDELSGGNGDAAKKVLPGPFTINKNPDKTKLC